MSTLVSRRTLLVASAGALMSSATSFDVEAKQDGRAVPPIPLFLRVVGLDGNAVAEPALVDKSVEAATSVFGQHGVAFFEAKARTTVEAKFADVITRDDRDAFAAIWLPGVINVFVVRKLEDVDEPGRARMGVAWRCLRDLKKKYVIVAAYAREVVLAHELGHFLGNPHSKVKNNLMSYDHDEGGVVFIDGGQARVARATARQLFAAKMLTR